MCQDARCDESGAGVVCGVSVRSRAVCGMTVWVYETDDQVPYVCGRQVGARVRLSGLRD